MNLEKKFKFYLKLILLCVVFSFATLKAFADQKLSTINLPHRTSKLIINTQTNKIYSLTSDGFDYKYSVIDGQTDTVVGTFNLPSNFLASTASDINPQTNKLYVPSENEILIFDLNTNTQVSSITLGGLISSIKVNPNTNRIYARIASDDLFILDPRVDKGIEVIDGNTNMVLSNFMSPGYIYEINLNANVLYTVDNDEVIYVIDQSSGNVVTTIMVDLDRVDELVFNHELNKLFVTPGDESNKLIVVDGTTHQITGAITFPGDLTSVGINPTTNKLYIIAYPGRNTPVKLYILDLRSNKILQKFGDLISVNLTNQIAVNSLTNKVYVSKEKEILVFNSDSSTSSDLTTNPFTETALSTLSDFIQSMKGYARDITQISSSIKRIIAIAKALSRTINSPQSTCTSRVNSLLTRLDQIVSNLLNKEISHPGFSDFQGDLESDFKNLRKVLLEDENNDGILDICVK